MQTPPHAPAVSWLGMDSRVWPAAGSSAPWIIRLRQHDFVLTRDAYLYLAQPKAFDVGWDVANQALWLIPSPTGFAVRSPGRSSTSRATQLIIHAPEVLAECRDLGFCGGEYWIWPQWYEPESTWSFFLPHGDHLDRRPAREIDVGEPVAVFS